MMPGMGRIEQYGKGFGKGFGKPFGKGFGKGFGSFGTAGDDQEQGMQGMIISYNPSKGYGFIKAARVPSDIYFKAQGNFPPGMVVAFTLKMNRDDKPSAINIIPGLNSGQ